MDCLFCKMVAGEIPTNKVYEDERVLAFEDLNPQMPCHTLIVPKNHYDNIGDNIRSENDDTDEQLNEQRILLQKAIRTLPEKQKLVFNLRFYDEMEYEQICEILSISMSAAKTNFHLAKEKIKSYIQSQPL